MDLFSILDNCKSNQLSVNTHQYLFLELVVLPRVRQSKIFVGRSRQVEEFWPAFENPTKLFRSRSSTIAISNQVTFLDRAHAHCTT